MATPCAIKSRRSAVIAAQSIPALRKLLLPSRRDTENKLAFVLQRELCAQGVQLTDFPVWLNLHMETWREVGEPSMQFANIIRSLIENAAPVVGPLLSSYYFTIQKELVDKHFFSHDQARTFLASTFLMYDLATRERMSAAQIARVMQGRGDNIPFSRQTVALLLAKLRIEPKLFTDQVKILFTQDSYNEVSYFGDADANSASMISSEIATSLGAERVIANYLNILAPEEQLDRYTAYLQILHYQCVIAEYFDHALLDIYEFTPRGQAAMWLFSEYPDSLAQASNPFLNNAKSVETLDEKWIRSKKEAERPGAMALFQVLCVLDNLHFEARREVAQVIRSWLHRIINLSAVLQVTLPVTLNTDQIDRIVARISLGNTGTFGIIEQRVVDLCSSHLHPKVNGWRSRGIGDSVNTTNVSQLKVGDCDHQLVSSRTIFAYEAHGGLLTDVYVYEHLRTMRSTLQKRSLEMSGVADLVEWTIQLVFVAHTVVINSRPSFIVDGVRVEISYQTFKQFVESVDYHAVNWSKYFLVPMSRRGTPNVVKRKVNAILSA